MAFFTARQPILNADKTLYAYELLFRDSLENAFPKDMDDDQATSNMVEGLVSSLGLEKLAHNHPAFINFTHETLLNRYPLILPKDHIVIEVLETVKPGKQLLEAIKEFKQNGYTIALDDYEHQAVWKHFYPYVDIIKIDFTLTTMDEVRQIIEDIKDFPKIKLLAEKIETYDEFSQAKELGFSYFQGYFFSRPEILQSRTLTPSHIALADIMSEMSKPEPDVNKVSKAFELDVNLSYKLLRYTQSPIFKRECEISTIKQAILVLGEQELRRFVSLLFATKYSDGKPPSLTAMSLIRARFCESLTCFPSQNQEQACAFLVGLLSLLDAMLDSDLAELLETLPLASHIKSALTSNEGELSTYLALVTCFEKADWQSAATISEKLNLDKDDTALKYQQAVIWANERQSLG
ncbi:EAL domain-containing protein [Alteromonadaceae bacterium M269]|nr:EAL domain-containing protein [Alteromonadaceae bacterium M269]